jgi:hypothetical protein
MAEAIAHAGDLKGDRTMEQDNRESWLNRVAVGMAPLFEALGTPLPSRVRVAIGFTSRGAKGKAIGECWDNRCSGDGHFEIFIRPDLAHAPDAMPAQIAAILAHELVHAAVGIAAGHGKAFKRIALGLGLVGPMRATTPGDVFLATITPILAGAGPLPHARLDTGGETTRPKKQGTRLLKCECEACGYTVRTARKWLELAGAPSCPIKGHGVMRHDPVEGYEDSDES